MKKLFNSIIDFIFPKYCVGCKTSGSYCCRNCFRKIRLLTDSHQKLSHKNTYINDIFAAASFQEPLVSSLIHTFKYSCIPEISGLLIPLYKNFTFIEPHSKIIPVPLHKKRLMFRGFNQSFLLAKAIARSGKELTVEESLIRHRNTLPQVELNGPKRIENVKGAFSYDFKFHPEPHKKHFIVDDVFTTGATIGECAKALKIAGVKYVGAIVIAISNPKLYNSQE